VELEAEEDCDIDEVTVGVGDVDGEGVTVFERLTVGVPVGEVVVEGVRLFEEVTEGVTPIDKEAEAEILMLGDGVLEILVDCEGV
jgi:hypothetical protein